MRKLAIMLAGALVALTACHGSTDPTDSSLTCGQYLGMDFTAQSETASYALRLYLGSDADTPHNEVKMTNLITNVCSGSRSHANAQNIAARLASTARLLNRN